MRASFSNYSATPDTREIYFFVISIRSHVFVSRRHSTRLFPTFSSFVSIYKQMVGGYVR